MNEPQSRAAALAFLRAHQPLAPEGARSLEDERGYLAALQRLALEPDPTDLPLVLGSFNGDLADSLFEACGEVLEALPAPARRAALALAVSEGPLERRAWAAGWVGEFPDPALLEPLAELLRVPDLELRGHALGGVLGIARQGRDPRALALLRETLARERDPAARVAIETYLRELEAEAE